MSIWAKNCIFCDQNPAINKRVEKPILVTKA